MSQISAGQLLIAGSIIAGSAIVATGLFLGLRASSPSAPSPPSGPPEHSTQLAIRPSSEPTAAAEREGAPPSDGRSAAASPGRAEAEVRGEFDRRRARYIEACSAAFPSAAGRAVKTSYVLSLVFDASGKQVIRAIDSTPDSVAAVARCLAGYRGDPFSITPTGTETRVALTITLPD